MNNDCTIYYSATLLGEEVSTGTVETEKLVAEMHAEFGRRRKITVSGLPVDFTEEVHTFISNNLIED